MKCHRVHCHYGTASSLVPKVQTFISELLQSTVEHGTDSVVLWAEFYVHNPLGIKENNEHALDFALH